MAKNVKQPVAKEVQRDTLSEINKNTGPDERGHYASISRVSNSSTTLNGLVISGPQGNGTI